LGSLRSRIERLLQDPLDQPLARSILGTTSIEEIAGRVEAYCRAHLGALVVIKAHGPDESPWGTAGSLEALTATYQVQAAAAAHGFPCAGVLRAPSRWDHGTVAVMTHLEGRVSADPHRPEVRRAMAESCAELVRMIADHRTRPDLPVSRLPAGQLWPRPHNVLFDLERPGADWIDERARAARAVLDAAAIYALAYTARAEHSGDPRGEKMDRTIRQILSRAPDRYFSL
jgi:hypothetical protein